MVAEPRARPERVDRDGEPDARATIVDVAERSHLWDQHVAALPWFAAYPEQTGRTIPMVRLSPVD